MAVKRIVANIAALQPGAARSFYCDILGLEAVMDHGWIVTLAAPEIAARPQVSIASEGGSGTAVPDLSVEVDNFEEVWQRAERAGLKLEYGPADEPWGVRRFYVRDPFGRLINVLTHSDGA
jgi:catechol 2,3-dioxygenase-like lactoylglutathione lyase family enzyme